MSASVVLLLIFVVLFGAFVLSLCKAASADTPSPVMRGQSRGTAFYGVSEIARRKRQLERGQIRVN